MTTEELENWSMTTSKSHLSTSAANFGALLPSILQCFSIILAGFLSRKINLISEKETKGVRNLLVYFLAPTMMCQCLLSIEWHEVNWKFLACAFVAKSFVFVGVAASTLFLSNDLCKSGIYAIFATQSNDMALGYPVAQALYSESHSDYPRYIYLLMPVSLLILNPIGFFVMEIEKRRKHPTDESARNDVKNIFVMVFKGLATNPMVISTLVGLIGNLIFRKVAMPGIIQVILSGFSVGFVPVALFSLGCTLVSSEAKSNLHCPFATVLLLTLAKILLLPLLLRELISLGQIGENSLDTSSLSTFGFLYGSLPTAPTVFVYATQYNVAVRQVAFGLALCTFLSAPWLYLSCRMISIHQLSHLEIENLLHFTLLNSNIIGLVASALGIGIFIFSRKLLRLPHCFVFCFLIVSVLLNSFMIVRLQPVDLDWWLYRMLCTFVVYTGQWMFRSLTVVLAMSLAVLRCIGFCRLIKYSKLFFVAAFALPTITAMIFVILMRNEFVLASYESVVEPYAAWFSLIIDTIVIVVSSVMLIAQYKFARSDTRVCSHSLVPSDPEDQVASTSTPIVDLPDIEDAVVKPKDHLLSAPGADDGDEQVSNDNDELMDETHDDDDITSSRQNLTSCPSTASCSAEQRYRCKRILQKYRRRTETLTVDRLDDLDEMETYADLDAEELAKHSIFVALLCVSAALNLFVNAWRVVKTDLTSATYVQLKLLDSITTYGQSLICVLLFATGYSVRNRLVKMLRRLYYGTDKLVLPKRAELDRPTKFVCDQFVRRHLTLCQRDVCRTIRRPLKVYKNVFRGCDFVDWLLQNVVVDDRTSAVRYGRRLILGAVIEHVRQEQHFYDSSLLYRFCQHNSSTGDGVLA